MAVIGAGAGGLAAAIDLSRQGCAVTVIDRAPKPGGKMRNLDVNGKPIAAGPTVFTMRWVFDGLFSDADTALEQRLNLSEASVLARHAWTDGDRLDLHASIDDSVRAIAEFSGPTDASAYRRFCGESQGIYDTLRDTFMGAQRPNPLSLTHRVGLSRIHKLLQTLPHVSLWSRLSKHFEDPRLVQLFARYSTYVGSSPFQAPATLMLIAHVEQSGVWLVDGGMSAVAQAMVTLAEERGTRLHFGDGVDEITTANGAVNGVVLDSGETLPVDAVVYNGDYTALNQSLLPAAMRSKIPSRKVNQRGLSAITWCIDGTTRGFPMAFHNVLFADDYHREFGDIFNHQRITPRPTVYICAQDRNGGPAISDNERMLMLINAPANGDTEAWPESVLESWYQRACELCEQCGLTLSADRQNRLATSPKDFHQRFPASGGSLYGGASQGMWSSFSRPGARAPIRGLYLAGGTVHPGPGVPMATLSGRLAAAALMADQL
ncbi:methoxyneurosporene dehydrogenase [Luminiphilus syltensis NOR5-1B]|uniref:Methoxyneurosporene dehydrogenase n=1 Tax=Luminiphilus syltensis NOR5-1B TaxID=565045 RepID=B8KT11_9GAMM|nr:methoxyneurosporene dehydrogenase [Luminiphilus syltensis NOR5-1B]